ncbi:MAG: S41 family peptidase [Saprospiraceae bacterium]
MYDINKNLEIFINVYKELNSDYVDKLDPATTMRTAIDAVTKSLDPYTNFDSESQVESYWINEDEKYQGIGARLGIVDQKCMILEPYEGGPSLKAGLKAGDEIISIGNVNIKGKPMQEINAILRGIPGTDIQMSVLKNGKTTSESVSVQRGEVSIPNVPYSGFVSEGIGYISLTVFTAQAGQNIGKALKDLKTQNPNMKGLILDLRQNGGGLLHEAVNICNLFIPQGEIVVTTKGKVKERDQSYKTMNQPLDLEMPLVILINKRSASASEIVSGVIQDYDRGVLLGQRSFGKGLVQNTRETGYNSRLKLTTSKYYIPSGRCIQGVEYENGEPKDIADHLRSKFKTRNGRTVLDGGGVTPDVKMEVKETSQIVKVLVDSQFIFKYANQFTNNNDSIAQPNAYTFNDFDDFMLFMDKHGYDHLQLEEEVILKKLISTLETSKTSPEVLQESKKLLARLHQQKRDLILNAKSQVIDEIENELVMRYYFQKGRTMHSLNDDAEIHKAIEILNDSNKYKSLLTKQ